MARFCSQCGSEIQPGSKFCMKCGTPVDNDSEKNRPVQNVSTPAAQNKSTGNNNKLIIALIVVLLVIGGICGYFFIGRSSDGKSAQNAAKQSESLAPKTAEKPISSVQQISVNQSSPRDAFISFHAAITNRQLAEAYNILTPNYQKFMRNYDNFARGYATTLRSDVVELNTAQEDSTSATLTYKLKAVDREGTGEKTQFFIGKAQLVKINGQWRIDSTEAKRASQTSTASGTTSTNSSKYSIKSGPYPVFLNGDPNYILVDAHMGGAWYLIRNSVRREESRKGPNEWDISCDVVSVADADKGNTNVGQSRHYVFRFSEHAQYRNAGIMSDHGVRNFNYNGPRSETMVINGAGAMAYYIAMGKKWPEFGFSDDVYSPADM